MKRFHVGVIALVMVVGGDMADSHAQPANVQAAQRGAQAAYDQLVVNQTSCDKARTTPDENDCLTSAVAASVTQFDRFYEALKVIVGLDAANLAALERTQALWTSYREESCKAIDQFWSGGTIAPSASMRCTLQITKSRVEDLEALYNVPLHH